MKLEERSILEFETGPVIPLMEAAWSSFLQACSRVYFDREKIESGFFRDSIRRRWRVQQLRDGAEMLIQPAAANLAQFFAESAVLTPPIPYEISVRGISVCGCYSVFRSRSHGLVIPQPFWSLPEASPTEPDTAGLCRWIHAQGLEIPGRIGLLWISISDGSSFRFADSDLWTIRRILEERIPRLAALIGRRNG